MIAARLFIASLLCNLGVLICALIAITTYSWTLFTQSKHRELRSGFCWFAVLNLPRFAAAAGGGPEAPSQLYRIGLTTMSTYVNNFGTSSTMLQSIGAFCQDYVRCFPAFLVASAASQPPLSFAPLSWSCCRRWKALRTPRCRPAETSTWPASQPCG